MNRVIVKSDEEYIKHLLAANKSQSDFIRQLQEERDVACGANAEYCDEITRLREKLRIAEETLCEYESREIDSGNLRGGIAAVALKEIREVE